MQKSQESLSQAQSDLQALQAKHATLEKDAQASSEQVTILRSEYEKVKESHSSEIQKSRISHSKAAELQIENKTLLSRVEELKQRLVTLTSEKLELVEKSEGLEKEVYKLRKQKDVVSRGSVELNTELDGLIQGQQKRETQREVNQQRYSQFVGGANVDGESMREINERRLKKGKDSGEFGREKEIGFVIDLVAMHGGCGSCIGEVLTL